MVIVNMTIFWYVVYGDLVLLGFFLFSGALALREAMLVLGEINLSQRTERAMRRKVLHNVAA